MKNVTNNFTDGGSPAMNLSTKSSEEIPSTEIARSISNYPSPTLLTDSWGWTTFEENFSGSPVHVTTFDDTEFDFNGTQATLYPSEGLPLDTGQIIIAAASVVVSFITVLGNLLVLYAFCAERRLRTYTNYYIVGLSFSDLVAGAFTMPMYSIYWVLGYWPFGAALCDIYLYLNHAFIHITVLGILVLAIDRYQAVSQPLRHLQMRTLSHASFMITIAYLIPSLIWLPYTILWPYIVGERRIIPGLCYPQYIVDSFFFTILVPICFIWIPLPIISVLYWRIYVVIRSKKKQRKGPVMMHDLDSTSTSNRAPNVSEGVSLRNLQQPVIMNDITIDTDTNARELGHGNLGFEPNEVLENDGRFQNTASGESLEVIKVSHLHDQPKPSKKDQGSKKDSNRATRTLTLIFIVLMVSSVPWSILVIIQCLCPTCLPLVLYQVCIDVYYKAGMIIYLLCPNMVVISARTLIWPYNSNVNIVFHPMV